MFLGSNLRIQECKISLPKATQEVFKNLLDTQIVTKILPLNCFLFDVE
jgi:hypothetical protein